MNPTMNLAVRSALARIGAEWKVKRLREAFTAVHGRPPYDLNEIFIFNIELASARNLQTAKSA